MFWYFTLVLCINCCAINTLKVLSTGSNAESSYHHTYNFLHRGLSSMGHLFSTNALCSLPITEKINICMKIVAAMYDTKVDQFQLADGMEWPSFDCVKKEVVSKKSEEGYLGHKSMYLCPIKNMVFDKKPPVQSDFFIANTKEPGTLFFLASKPKSKEANVLHIVKDVDLVLGSPVISERNSEAEIHFVKYWNKRKQETNWFFSGKKKNKNIVCSLPPDHKLKLCKIIISLMYDVSRESITSMSTTKNISYSCHKKDIYLHFTQQSIYPDQIGTKKMYLCPVKSLQFPGKPENVLNIYITNGDVPGTVFVMNSIDQSDGSEMIVPILCVTNFVFFF